MKHAQIRKVFNDFFAARDHKIYPPAPLIPQADPSVLFTSAGMQQFKPYYLHPQTAPYKNAASVQPCLRTSDIDRVGDDTHLTFFEMMGNFSFGGYFKKSAIKLALELLTMGYKISPNKLFITIFPGDKNIPLDQESIAAARKIGVADDKIKMGDKKDNFWGPTGDEGPCGPTVEFHFVPNFGDPLELWNLVFNEYHCSKDKKLTKLKTPGVDTGMGIERLAAVLQKAKSIYETDLFSPIIAPLYPLQKRSQRIVADHIRSIIFLATEGIIPSNKEQGYILRRLLRRMLALIFLEKKEVKLISPALSAAYKIYHPIYPAIGLKKDAVEKIIGEEQERFGAALRRGVKEFENKAASNKIDDEFIFHLFSSYGFPFEVSLELCRKKNIQISRENFDKLFAKHQEKSRLGSVKKFSGGLVEITPKTTKLHTAHHLLLAALRAELGNNIRQKGSNITDDRLRIDFNCDKKLTPSQISKIENIVNQAIKCNLKVVKEEMALEKALKSGALGEFGKKYGKRVTVYTIQATGDQPYFSQEICGGPHVLQTKELGRFKIIKQEASSAGVRRIKAVLE